jgi:hypothetical protein
MKPLSLFAAVCLFSSLLAGQTTVTSFHSTAESAGLNITVNKTGITLSIFRGDTGAFLFYFASTQNSDGSVTQTVANGEIPGEDFTTGGMEHMTLNVDTSQVAGFQSTSCTVTFAPSFSSSCSPGPLGVIQINWTNNRIFSTSTVLENHETPLSGPIKIDTHVDADQSSADASGSFLGLSFTAPNQGSIDLNRSTTITITQ